MTAERLFEAADWDFPTLQRIHDACAEIARSELGTVQASEYWSRGSCAAVATVDSTKARDSSAVFGPHA